MERFGEVEDIVILGTSGFAKEVLFLLERNNIARKRWNILGFVDNMTDIKAIKGYPLLGDDTWLQNQKGKKKISVVCGIGNPHVRKKVVEKYEECTWLQFPSIIDDSAILSETVKIGKGSIVCAGNIVTVDIEIGNFTIINLDCTVGHDSKIGDYVTLNPSCNISGNVTIGKQTEVGTGTHIIQGISVSHDVTIGAGSVVIRDVEEHTTVVGNPARLLHKKQNESVECR